MIMEIGIAAGDIWHYLEEKGPMNVKELVLGLNKSRNLVLMSLGWLAREGHVSLADGENFRVTLRS